MIPSSTVYSVAWEFRGTVVYDTTVGIEVDYARFFNDVSR